MTAAINALLSIHLDAFFSGLATSPCLWLFDLYSRGCCLSISSVHLANSL